MIKKCEMCHLDFEARAHNAKYCPSCRKEADRQYKLKSRGTPTTPVTCQRCGKDLGAVRRNTKWCEECRTIVHREQNLRYDALHPDRPHKKKHDKPKVPTLFLIIHNKKQRMCRCCSQEFTAQGNERTYPTCKAIQHEKTLARQRERNRRILTQKKVNEATGKPVKTIDDWAREAAECNLDYGTYRALIAAGKSFEELKARAGNRGHTHHAHCYRFL